MRLGLGIALNRGAFVGGLDQDAKAYIAAVEAKGATVSAGQEKALNTFYKTGKSEGWYSSLRRLYLPIWAAAAPNAVDMLTATSGTFAGTITHSNGFATGNGSTGVFNYNTNANSQGLSSSTGSLFWLCYTSATSGVQLGAMQGVTNRAALYESNTYWSSELTSSSTAVSGSEAGVGLGILLSTRTSTTSHKVFQRRSSFSQKGVTNTTAETFSAPTATQCAWARGRDGTTRDLFSNAGLGAHGFGLGLSDSAAEAFTLALKNLWETCTGLTLP